MSSSVNRLFRCGLSANARFCDRRIEMLTTISMSNARRWCCSVNGRVRIGDDLQHVFMPSILMLQAHVTPPAPSCEVRGFSPPFERLYSVLDKAGCVHVSEWIITGVESSANRQTLSYMPPAWFPILVQFQRASNSGLVHFPPAPRGATRCLAGNAELTETHRTTGSSAPFAGAGVHLFAKVQWDGPVATA